MDRLVEVAGRTGATAHRLGLAFTDHRTGGELEPTSGHVCDYDISRSDRDCGDEPAVEGHVVGNARLDGRRVGTGDPDPDDGDGPERCWHGLSRGGGRDRQTVAGCEPAPQRRRHPPSAWNWR